MSDKPQYKLTFTPVASQHDPRPLPIRIRLLLKHALRSLNLRCVEAVEVKDRDGEPSPENEVTTS